MAPETTLQPAMVPALVVLNTWRTSAEPSTVSRISGFKSPDIAFFTSATAS